MRESAFRPWKYWRGMDTSEQESTTAKGESYVALSFIKELVSTRNRQRRPLRVSLFLSFTYMYLTMNSMFLWTAQTPCERMMEIWGPDLSMKSPRQHLHRHSVCMCSLVLKELPFIQESASVLNPVLGSATLSAFWGSDPQFYLYFRVIQGEFKNHMVPEPTKLINS